MNWEILKSTYPFECPWLRVRKDQVRLPSGLEIPDFYVEELPDWVNIIAITKDGLFVIEEQYRHGIKKICFELPAGSIDFGEDALTAAKRELKDETGYTGGEWISFGTSAPNASGCNCVCHTFIAKNVERTSPPSREPSEDIIVHLLPKEDIKSLLVEGAFPEAVMQAPLWRFISEQ